jgi:hypothetical protein
MLQLRILCFTLPLLTFPVNAQSNAGELRLKVTGPDDLAFKTAVELVSQGNEYRHTFTTDDQGNLDAKRLPYGIYQVQIHTQGFAPVSESVEIRSALPLDRTIRLRLASASESMTVSASGTLVDPYRSGSFNEMGLQTIENRLTALPGRSMQDLVTSEPGWLYEGNAVFTHADRNIRRNSSSTVFPLPTTVPQALSPRSKPTMSNPSRFIPPAFLPNMGV